MEMGVDITLVCGLYRKLFLKDWQSIEDLEILPILETLPIPEILPILEILPIPEILLILETELNSSI